MSETAVGYISTKQISNEIDRVIPTLGPEVVKVKYRIGPDTGGDPSIRFKIVLTDEACREGNLMRVSRRVEGILLDELHPYENWDMHLYTSFRSHSEHLAINDPSWA